MPDLQIEPSEFSTLIVSVLCLSFQKKKGTVTVTGKVLNELSIDILHCMLFSNSQQGFILMNAYLFQGPVFCHLAAQSTPLGPDAGLDA